MSNYWNCALLRVVLSRPTVARCNAMSESKSERSVTATNVLRHWGCALPWGGCQDAGVARCFGGLLSGCWGCALLCGLLENCQSCALLWGDLARVMGSPEVHPSPAVPNPLLRSRGCALLRNDLVELLRLRITLWSSQAAAGARCFGVMCLRR